MSSPLNFTIAFSPENEKLRELVAKAAEKLKTDVMSLKNSTELERYLMENELFCGVVFDDSLSNISKLPNNLTYALRFPAELRAIPPQLKRIAAFAGNWRTEVLFDQFLGNRPRNLRENDGGVPSGYAREGFLQVQNAIERSFIALTSGSNEEIPEINVQRYPYPPYTLDPVLTAIEFFLPFLMVQSFLFISINTIKVSFW